MLKQSYNDSKFQNFKISKFQSAAYDMKLTTLTCFASTLGIEVAVRRVYEVMRLVIIRPLNI
jgi:hypothetical protein